MAGRPPPPGVRDSDPGAPLRITRSPPFPNRRNGIQPLQPRVLPHRKKVYRVDHQQFLILAIYPAVARLPKIILPTLGIYLGTVRNRFGPLDTARNCFVPLGTCLGVLCTFGELYVPTYTGVAFKVILFHWTRYKLWWMLHLGLKQRQIVG